MQFIFLGHSPYSTYLNLLKNAPRKSLSSSYTLRTLAKSMIRELHKRLLKTENRFLETENWQTIPLHMTNNKRQLSLPPQVKFITKKRWRVNIHYINRVSKEVPLKVFSDLFQVKKSQSPILWHKFCSRHVDSPSGWDLFSTKTLHATRVLALTWFHV